MSKFSAPTSWPSTNSLRSSVLPLQEARSLGSKQGSAPHGPSGPVASAVLEKTWGKGAADTVTVLILITAFGDVTGAIAGDSSAPETVPGA